MMYDMTMKVVTPAIVSRAIVVSFAANLKRRSSSPPFDCPAACSLIDLRSFGRWRPSERE
jgi:hypothetical protein